jgi:hypothetical protein
MYSAAIRILNYSSVSVILFRYHNSYSKFKNLSWFAQDILLFPVLGASVPFSRLSSISTSNFLWTRCVLYFTKQKLLVWNTASEFKPLGLKII